MTQLLDCLADLVVFFGGARLSDEPLEPCGNQQWGRISSSNWSILKGALLSLVVELVSEQALDCGIHDDVTIARHGRSKSLSDVGGRGSSDDVQ